MSLHDRVSHRLKLRDLRLLLALDEWGSMAKAAAHLNLTQSGVSKAIAELEHTFGVRLVSTGRRRASSRRPMAARCSRAAWRCSTSCGRASMRSSTSPTRRPANCGLVALRRCPGESFRSSSTGSSGSTRGWPSMYRRRILRRSDTMICASARSTWRSAGSSARSRMTMSMLKSCTTKRRSSSPARTAGGPSVARSRSPSLSTSPGACRRLVASRGPSWRRPSRRAACPSRTSTRCRSRSRFTTPCSRPGIFCACCRTRCFSSARTSYRSRCCRSNCRPAPARSGSSPGTGALTP